MDPDTFSLMNRLRKLLDPRGIMNPGNWEADWEADREAN
jgi:FAD/FMN-containing dehydrogenase